MVDIDVYVSSLSKEELAWAVDKRLHIISTIMLFNNTKKLKELKNKAILNLNNIVYHIVSYF